MTTTIRKLYKALILLGLVLSAADASSQERYEFYNGVRQMGMGGAGIAVVNDETAMLLNPAGLGKLRDYFLTVVDPEVDTNGNIERIAGTDVLNSMEPQAALDMLNDGNYDRRLHTRVQLFPSLVLPHFGLGVFAKYAMDAEVSRATMMYDLNYRNDLAAVMGVNFKIWDGRIKLGANARVVNRVEINTSLPNTSTNLKRSDLADEGIGVASDIGLILTAPWKWLPTLAAVWRDVGDTSYRHSRGMLIKTDETRRPDSTPQTVDVAVALFPIGSKASRWTWTAEYRDVLTMGEEDDQIRRLHMGLEYNLADAVFVRGGMHQRYWTAGLELASRNVQFQMATYGEEIGTPTKYREDRRFNFKLSYRY